MPVSQIRTVPSSLRGEPAAVRRDRHRAHCAVMVGQSSPFLPGVRIPDPHCPVLPPAVRASGRLDRHRQRRRRGRRWPVPDGPSPALVTASQIRTVPSSPPLANQLPSGAIATANTVPSWRAKRAVPARWPRPRSAPSRRRRRWRASGRPVRSPPRTLGRLAGQEGRSCQVAASPTCCTIAVAARGGEPAAVRRDRHGFHPVMVAGQGGTFLRSGRVPDPHRPAVAPCGEPAAVRRGRYCDTPGRGGRAEGPGPARSGSRPRCALFRRCRRWRASCRSARSPPCSPA